MAIKIKDNETLYGFGAAAARCEDGPSRSNRRVLSFVALALSSAVIALMIVLVPMGSAAANTIISNSGQTADGLGLAATLAFGLSTALGAALLFAPGLIRQRMRRNRRR